MSSVQAGVECSGVECPGVEEDLGKFGVTFPERHPFPSPFLHSSTSVCISLHLPRRYGAHIPRAVRAVLGNCTVVPAGGQRSGVPVNV